VRVPNDSRYTGGGAREDPAVTDGRDAALGRAVLAIVAGAVLVAAAIGVRGEFALSDDASYAFTTRTLCETSTWRFLPWSAPSLVVQAAYGAVLCHVFGFSFTVLRASTVVLGVTGVIGFWLLLRRLGVRGALLGLATALLAFNPLYLNLAFTFMTDVPFVVLLIWAALAYADGLADRRAGRLLQGALLASAALLVRQHGILIAGAAAVAALTTRAWPLRERSKAAAVALALPAATFVAYHLWIVGSAGVPVGYESRLGQLRAVSVATVVNCGFRGLCYLGLFALPLAASAWRTERRVALAATAAMTLLAAALFVRERALMFYLTNVLYDFGVGALTLRDTLFLGLPPPVRLGAALTVPLTAAALAGAGLLVAAWWSALRRSAAPAAVFVHLSAAFFFGATLLQARYYLDRHLLMATPFVLAAVLVASPPRRPSRVAVVLVALLAWWSVAGTHDYLAWNRARHDGLEALRAAGVPPTQIDGGVEFNAWYLAPELGTWPTDAEARSGQPATVRSWWWVVDDRWVASFRPLDGYVERDRRAYRRWLVPGTGEVLILERAASS